MQIKIFNIPIGAEDTQIEEMNHFLRANKIIDIKKEVAVVAGNSCWTFCITYMLSNRPVDADNARPGNSNKVDYKELLEPAAFERFSMFRKIRKQVADSEAIPAFAVFTDAELSEMAKVDHLTLSGMEKIQGIGKRKIEKYGMAFVSQAKNDSDEAGRIFDGADSHS